MTLVEKLKEAAGNSGYIDVFVGGEIVLDGTFTLVELKTMVAIIEREQVQLPPEWVVKHYAGSEWPVIKSAGIELDCGGATRAQAEAIAGILNAASPKTEG